jgi:hypothetical protein
MQCGSLDPVATNALQSFETAGVHHAARAQQPAMPVIRFLGATSPDTNADYLRAFRPGLKDSGYIEGESVAILTLEKATRRRLSKLGGARV